MATVANTIFQFPVDKLLAPISPENPVGEDLRYGPVYDRIRELRREDDETLPQGVWKADLKRADWNTVEAVCLDALETKSKDLQVAAWLLESWAHLYGFVGAAEGFRVMHALSRSFWDNLYPQIEGGDVDFRIAPIEWVNRKLPTYLKLVYLTAPEASDVPPCSLADWEIATQTSNLHPRSVQEATAKGRGMTLARFQQSAVLTPTPEIGTRFHDARALLARCRDFDVYLDEKLGRDAPGLLAVRRVVESILELLAALLRDRSATDFPEPGADRELTEYAGIEAQQGGGFDASPLGRIRTRIDAYQMLSEAADFLARTEPHSPTPYLVRRAIVWGSLTLEELLPELVRNQSELSDIYRLLNVKAVDAAKK
ncbi:MAG TPA: type VI secretion system protein TssA [Bryobacteraceae bacterium]|jgi:type VI secretion system ImpA family protein|nr:type VI secretion system protein TssA [Bryobacteraceae bacterium]